MKKHEIEVFQFEELSEEAQDRAITDNASINVEDSWWYAGSVQEGIEERYESRGIGVNHAGLCFDLDRGSYLYFSHTSAPNGGRQSGVWIESQDKLAKALYKEKVISKAVHDAVIARDLYFTADTKHYGGGHARNYIEVFAETDDGYKVLDAMTEKEHDAIDDFMRSLESESISDLRNEYDGATERDAIIETLVANEYEFTADGRMWPR